MSLDDKNYLKQFAARELGPEHFDHRGHLRMAWLHLKHYDVDEARARICEGIRELAAKFGAPEKFNYTLSKALVRLMGARMAEGRQEDFDTFLEANSDLVSDCLGVMDRYYSQERLHSKEAHSHWLAPDRDPLDGE